MRSHRGPIPSHLTREQSGTQDVHSDFIGYQPGSQLVSQRDSCPDQTPTMISQIPLLSIITLALTSTFADRVRDRPDRLLLRKRSDGSDDDHASIVGFGQQRSKRDRREVRSGNVDSVGSTKVFAVVRDLDSVECTTLGYYV
jgi:hypothetical protein